MKYPEWILERAYGGTDVADTPGYTSGFTKWAEGPSMPASREACELLLDACETSDSECTFLFLVGGAGNGKSFLAGQVAERLDGKLIGKVSQHASRLYRFAVTGDRELHIVNDATIPPSGVWESKGDALRGDVDNVVGKRGHLLCCVNRGVLIRETMDRPEIASVGSGILEWLVASAAGKLRLPEGWASSEASSEPSRDHYVFARLTGPVGEIINVHVVFMDNPSLLEPTAATKAGDSPASALKPDRRISQSVWKSNANKPRMARDAIHETIAAYLADMEEEVDAADPVRANAIMLSDESVVSAFTGVARGAEVLSGTHFTYRDLWGLTSVAVTGALQGRDMKEHGEWVDRRVAEAADGSPDSRLHSMLQLATLRSHQALFQASLRLVGSSQTAMNQAYPTAQALRAMRLADPVRGLDVEIRKSVTDQLFLLEEDEKPGHRLASKDPRFAACWTEFDQRLEDTVVAWLHAREEDEAGSSRKQVSKRRNLVSWYGEYLARLMSFSHGFPAFPQLVHTWQDTWRSASVNSVPSSIEDDLESGLLNLAFPSEKGKSALPIFDEHIVPTNEGPSGGRVLIQLKQKDYRVRAITRGDKIILKLSHDVHEGESELILDFPLLREISARHEGAGFTDAMFDVEPRVERLRARGMMLAIGRDVDQVSGKIVFGQGDQMIAGGGAS